METASVVDVVDEPWKVLGDVGEGFVGHRIDRLDLESLHEAFGLGVVVGIASAPHRTDKTAAKQGFPIGLSGVLGGFKRSSQHDLCAKDAPNNKCYEFRGLRGMIV